MFWRTQRTAQSAINVPLAVVILTLVLSTLVQARRNFIPQVICGDETHERSKQLSEAESDCLTYRKLPYCQAACMRLKMDAMDQYNVLLLDNESYNMFQFMPWEKVLAFYPKMKACAVVYNTRIYGYYRRGLAYRDESCSFFQDYARCSSNAVREVNCTILWPGYFVYN